VVERVGEVADHCEDHEQNQGDEMGEDEVFVVPRVVVVGVEEEQRVDAINDLRGGGSIGER
jgi:hypothetical protein